MEENLKAGDCVQLKSGSPKMTINIVEGQRAHCLWFVGDEAKDKYIMLSALKPCEETTEQK